MKFPKNAKINNYFPHCNHNLHTHKYTLIRNGMSVCTGNWRHAAWVDHNVSRIHVFNSCLLKQIERTGLSTFHRLWLSPPPLSWAHQSNSQGGGSMEKCWCASPQEGWPGHTKTSLLSERHVCQWSQQMLSGNSQWHVMSFQHPGSDASNISQASQSEENQRVYRQLRTLDIPYPHLNPIYKTLFRAYVQ